MQEIKVKLRENRRIIDEYDCDFYIKAGEVKILNPRVLKSYALRQHILNGDLILVEGEVEFVFKDSLFRVSAKEPTIGYFLMKDRTIKKDLVTNIIMDNICN